MVVFLVAAIVFSACQSSPPPPATQISSHLTPPPSATNTAPAPTEAASTEVTAWDQVLSQIQPDGTVTAETALQAFALAVSPLPGITTPDGTPGDVDADLAVPWVEQVRDQLGTEQQAAIDAALAKLSNPFTTGGLAPAASDVHAPAAKQANAATVDLNCGLFSSDPKAPPTEVPAAVLPYVPLFQRASAALAAHLYRSPMANIVICMAPPGTLGDIAFTRVLDAENQQIGLPHTCALFLNEDKIGDRVGADLGFLMAQAAFNCFKVTANPAETLAAILARGIVPWVWNGAAIWASATVTLEEYGGTGDRVAEIWAEYLLDPHVSLPQRADDAIGFFAQVEQSGKPVWGILDAMLTAADSDAAFYIATGGRQAFTDLWAAGYFRDASRGPDWDIVGPGIPNDTAEARSLEVANGETLPVAVPPFSVLTADLSSSAEVTFLASDRLRIHDGVQDIKEVTNQAYCTSGSGNDACKCPKDTPGATRPPPPSLNPDVKLAVTGMQSGAFVLVRGLSLEDYCGQPATPVPASGAWSMVFWSPDMGDRVPPLLVAYTCDGLLSTWKAIYLPSDDGLTELFEWPFADSRVVHEAIHRDIPARGISGAVTLDYSLDFTLNAEADPPVIIVTGTKTESQVGRTWVFSPREFGSDAPLELKNVSLETQLEPYPDYQHPFRAQALEECGG